MSRPRRVVAPLDLVASKVQIPHHFRCPISLDLMRDPVTVSTGQTYDRSSIESWTATGNTTCPVTRAPLAGGESDLIPNHTLRRLIQSWCVAHRVDRIPTPKHPADPSLVRLLVASADAAALRRLRVLAGESEKNRAVISSPETRSAVIEMMFEPDLVAEALALLAVLLPLSEAEIAAVAARIERLAVVLAKHQSIDVRISAAAVIEAVAKGSEVRAAVGAAEGVMEGLVALVRERGNAKAVRVGIKGMFSLCLGKENRGRAVAAGAVRAVMEVVEGLIGERGGHVEQALATVELLCRDEQGREAVAGGGTAAVRLLVRVMSGKASERAAEHAAGALVAVVGGSEVLQWEAVAAGVVPQLLLMVQGCCSDRAKRKAQLLLKLLHAAWPHYYTANSDASALLTHT